MSVNFTEDGWNEGNHFPPTRGLGIFEELRLVPLARLERARLSTLDFESGVKYTNHLIFNEYI